MISPFLDPYNAALPAKKNKWCQHGNENGKCEHCYEEQSLHALEVMDCGLVVGRTPEALPGMYEKAEKMNTLSGHVHDSDMLMAGALS